MKQPRELAELIRSYADTIGVIKMAQIEAYNEAVDDCINNIEIDEYDEHMQYSPSIDKQVLLKLKK